MGRLKKHRLKACTVSVCMKDSKFNTMVRQLTFRYPTDSVNYMFNRAYGLLIGHFTWEHPLRSIGVRADNLYALKHEQMSLFDDSHHPICIDIDVRLKELTERFGVINVEKAATSKDWD